MRLFLTRHPIAKANIEGIAQGQAEGDINENGLKQIEELILRLKDEKIDYVFSSDSVRCKKLASAVANSKRVGLVYNPIFREINNGDLSNISKLEISRIRFWEDILWRPKGGESLLDLDERSKRSKEYLLNQPYERMLLISHGWFLKSFVGSLLLMGPLEYMRRLKFSNCSLSEISFDKDNYIIEYLNNREYLKTR